MSNVFDDQEHAAFSKWYLPNEKDLNVGTEQVAGEQQGLKEQKDEGEQGAVAQPEVSTGVVAEEQQNGK